MGIPDPPEYAMLVDAHWTRVDAGALRFSGSHYPARYLELLAGLWRPRATVDDPTPPGFTDLKSAQAYVERAAAVPVVRLLSVAALALLAGKTVDAGARLVDFAWHEAPPLESLHVNGRECATIVPSSSGLTWSAEVQLPPGNAHGGFRSAAAARQWCEEVVLTWVAVRLSPLARALFAGLDGVVIPPLRRSALERPIVR